MLSAKHSLLESLMPKENVFKTGTFPEIRAHDNPKSCLKCSQDEEINASLACSPNLICMTNSPQPWPDCFGKYAKLEIIFIHVIYTEVSAPPFLLSMLQNGKRQPCVK